MLLERYRLIVDELHGRLALAILMQTESASVRQGMRVEEFRELARAVVADRSVDSSHEVDPVELIIRFSCERLVLIVGNETGYVGFEIKPLVEFLAASELNRARDENLVRERFRVMAVSAAWSDVTRFLAAAQFDARTLASRDIRDSIIMTIRELDDAELSGVDALRLRGASLGIEIMADASLEGSNNYSRHLWPNADIVNCLQPYQLEMLADLALRMRHEGWFQKFLCELEDQIPERGDDHGASWSLFTRIARALGPEMTHIVEEKLEGLSPERLTQLLPDTEISTLPSASSLGELLQRADPNAVNVDAFPETLGADAPSWVQAAWMLIHSGSNGRDLSSIYLEEHWPIGRLVSLRNSQWLEALSEMPAQHHRNWNNWIKFASFLRDPSSPEFSLLNFTEPEFVDPEDDWATSRILPWPAREKALAGVVDDGSIDLSSWLAAEDRWRDNGVTLADIEAYLDFGALTPRVSEAGFPFASIHWSMPTTFDPSVERVIIGAWNAWSSRASRYRIPVARTVLIPMCDYNLRHSKNILDAHMVHQIVSQVALGNIRASVTFSTIATALNHAGDYEFSALAGRTLQWLWLLEPEADNSELAVEVVQRASRLLSTDDFSELCVRVAERRDDEPTWGKLVSFWPEKLTPDSKHANFVKLITRENPGTVSVRDLRVIARNSPSRRLVDVVLNIPFWSREDRETIANRLKIEIGERWVEAHPESSLPSAMEASVIHRLRRLGI
jgi:hypothetical protein